jgi:hypothetical protein
MKNENKYNTMIFGLLTLITALSISAVAIYYSVAGLMAIFAAAALPIMIMGGTLEIAKLVTAVWLHKYWNRATWWLKSYLSVAVVVLMFITSMGIFGFLSSAHIEQTSASTESVARVESITGEIARQNSIIERAEGRIKQLESSGTGSDANVQSQIDKEQERIDNAYARIQPAIDEQNKIIGSQAKLFQDELDRIDTAMQTVAGYIDSGDRENYKKAQAIIGVRPDGAFGSGSTRAYTAWKDAKNAERQVLLTNIQQATNNPQARAAANEIKRLRTTVETQIAESNKLINRLRANIGKTDNSAQIQAEIDAQQDRIKLANTEIDTLSQERVELEAVYRKLEAEVGPIKYIAEFIYGDTADKNLMEEAVRWVIIIIIFVFDPLAVLLLIAAQYTFEFRRKELEDDDGERLRLEREEYERARAQRIVDNPGFTPSTSVPESDPHPPGWMFNSEEKQSEDDRREDREETEQVDTSLPEAQPSETAETQTETDQVVVAEEKAVDVDGLSLEQFEELETIVIEDKEEYVVSESEWEQLEAVPEWQDAKTAWKVDNPTMSLKFFKELFLKGKIDKLPWEDYLDEDSKKKSYMMKHNRQQIRKTTDPTP